MTDIEIPDNEQLRSLACLRDLFNERSEYCWASMIDSAARRLRADAEEIARLHEQINRDTECIREVQAELNRVYELRDDLRAQLAAAKTEAAAQRELATLLERESTDPLTRIAAALERPPREWVAALTLVGAARDCPTYESAVTSAFKFADALLAEIGEK